MADKKDDSLAIPAAKQLSMRASLVRRGLEEIKQIQHAQAPITGQSLDYAQLKIVATVTNQWTMRNEPFPGKTYVMFTCDLENRGDNAQTLGKEVGICFRSKASGEVSYLGDAVWLAFSHELVLPPYSATCLDLELEISTPEGESTDSYLRFVFCDEHDLLGYDYSHKAAILLIP